jgi:hypothetical protein
MDRPINNKGLKNTHTFEVNSPILLVFFLKITWMKKKYGTILNNLDLQIFKEITLMVLKKTCFSVAVIVLVF